MWHRFNEFPPRSLNQDCDVFIGNKCMLCMYYSTILPRSAIHIRPIIPLHCSSGLVILKSFGFTHNYVKIGIWKHEGFGGSTRLWHDIRVSRGYRSRGHRGQLHELSCTALESFQSSSLLTPKMSINGLQVEASCQVVVYGVGYSFRKLIVQAGTQVFRVVRLVV